jgi:hypothetical protein
VAASRTVSRIVNGTPAAVVADDPKLDRMSLRTMPESSSTFGPLEPSAGKGPPVSSGTSVSPEAAAVAPELDAAPVRAGAAVAPSDASDRPKAAGSPAAAPATEEAEHPAPVDGRPDVMDESAILLVDGLPVGPGPVVGRAVTAQALRG